MTKAADRTLADNLAWIKANTDLDSQAKIGKAAGMDQTTVGRIMRASHAPTLDKLIALANVLKIETWQLLAKGFGAGLYEIDADRRIVPVRLPKKTKAALSAGPDEAPPLSRRGQEYLEAGEAGLASEAPPSPKKRTAVRARVAP